MAFSRLRGRGAVRRDLLPGACLVPLAVFRAFQMHKTSCTTRLALAFLIACSAWLGMDLRLQVITSGAGVLDFDQGAGLGISRHTLDLRDAIHLGSLAPGTSFP